MEIEGVFTAILVGLVIGALGRLVLPGRTKLPLWVTIVLGIVGAVVGSMLADVFGVEETKGIDWIEIFFQVGVAAVGVGLAVRARTGIGRK